VVGQQLAETGDHRHRVTVERHPDERPTTVYLGGELQVRPWQAVRSDRGLQVANELQRLDVIGIRAN